MFSTGFTSLISYFFFFNRSPFSSLCTIFDSISSNTHKVLSINSSANVYVFDDFHVHHKDWLTYSGGTDRLVNSAIIFLSHMTLLRWLTILLGSLTDSHSPAPLDLILYTDTSICSALAFPPTTGKF